MQNEKTANAAKICVQKFYIHEIATVNLSKTFFQKNAKKIWKPNNRDLYRDWIISFDDLNFGINNYCFFSSYEIGAGKNVIDHNTINLLFASLQ